MYRYDPTYLLILPAILFTMYAQFKVSSSYKKYKEIRNKKGLTGAKVARIILDSNGLSDVPVNSVEGNLTDHYDPRNRSVSLSKDIYSSKSIASLAVAAHECGHAIQHAQKYPLMSIRSALVPAVNLSSMAAWPLIMIELIIPALSQSYASLGNTLLEVGIIFFGAVVLFHLVTLPVETNASSRALKQLETLNLVTDEDKKGARKMLTAAAMTYLAALAVALMNMLRLIIILNRRR